jgi:hypothetical protein
VYPAEATIVVTGPLSVLPPTDSVWVRVPQPDPGSLSTTLFTLTDAPRSTWSHCGKALFALSQ